MLTANANLQIVASRSTFLNSDLHQLTNPTSIDRSKRIGLDDLKALVSWQERTRVVTAHSKSGLSQVVGTEREELGGLCNLIGCDRSTGHFDHRTNAVSELLAASLHDFSSHAMNNLDLQIELSLEPNQRHHHLRLDLNSLFQNRHRCLENRPSLHLGDLGTNDTQSTSPETEHGVELMQFIDHLGHFCNGRSKLLGNLFLPLLVVRLGQELVQRRIEQTDASRQTIEGSENPLEILLLVRQQLGQSRFASILRLGQDHLPHGDDAIPFKEHMLGTAQTDPFGPKRHSVENLIGLVGVGAKPQRSILIGQLHDEVVVLKHLRILRLKRLAYQDLLKLTVGGVDLTVEDLSRRAVDADRVAFLERDPFALKHAFVVIDLDIARTCDADLTHLTGNQCRVARYTTACRQNPVGGDHPSKIFRTGLNPCQYNMLPLGSKLFGFPCRENHGARSSTWTSRQTNSHLTTVLLGLVISLDVEDRLEQLIEGLRIPRLDRMLWGHQLFLDHVMSDLDISQCGPLAISSLKHVKLLVLDGELEVLNIAKVSFEGLTNLNQFLVSCPEDLVLGHLGNLQRSAYTGHDVFTLSIDQVFAVEDVFAVSRVAGKGNARGAVITHVSKDHALDVDRSTPFIWNAVLLAIKNRPLVHPGTKHGLHCPF